MSFNPNGAIHTLDQRGIYQVAVDQYPDSMPLVKTTRSWDSTEPPVERILVRPSSLHAFMTAMFFVDALQERGGSTPELVLPCLPGARQDRLNDSGDFLFTAKSIAREINMRNFPRVITVDPHSEVMPALIDRCHVVHAWEVLGSKPSWVDAVVSPDAGAEKRAGAVARLVEKPLLHAWKTRDVKDGSLSGFDMEPLDDYEQDGPIKLFVVDDICDGGGTFIGLIESIDAHYNVEAHLYVTHGYFTKGVTELLQRYLRVVTTDTVIPGIEGRLGVTVLPICEQLLNHGRLAI